MQTRRKTQAAQDAGVKGEAGNSKRAPKTRRLLLSTVHQKPDAKVGDPEKLSAHPFQSSSHKRIAKGRHGKASSASPSRRRRAQASITSQQEKGVKKSVASSTTSAQTEKISINRAPVLTMWVAVVAAREGYTYEEGLSFGKAIAGLMAQSKGRSLGIYQETSEEKKEERKRKRKELDKFPVFGMNVPGIKTKDGLRLALQSEKPISPASVASYLHRSFGANHERAKGAMEDLASSFPSEGIGGEAYSLYEKFRPTVAHGVKGWGAKGLLDIDFMCTLRNQ